MRVESSGIKETIAHLKELKKKSKGIAMHDILERLANEGLKVARAGFDRAIYDGENLVDVTLEWVSDNEVNVVASGKNVLFIEFGSGALYGYGHPLAKQFGYGPGTWSTNVELGGKGHWDDPKGWYYKHGVKSWGNPPAMAMYEAAQEMRNRVNDIIKGAMQ